MKITKEQLLEDNAKLQEQLNNWVSVDKTRRDTFAELLGQYTEESIFGQKVNRKADDINWYRIAFLVGELKADADYSCLLAAREDLKRQNEKLLDEIWRLQHPKPEADGPCDSRPCR